MDTGQIKTTEELLAVGEQQTGIKTTEELLGKTPVVAKEKRKKSIWERFIPTMPPTATPRETLEGLGSAASGLAAFPASVGTSLWLMNKGLTPAAAEKLGQTVAGKITYKPTTGGGQALAEGLGGIFKPLEVGSEFAAKTVFPKSEEGQAAVRIGLATALLLTPYVSKGIKGFIQGKVKARVDVTPGELKAIAKVSKGAPAEVLAKVEQITKEPSATRIDLLKPKIQEGKTSREIAISETANAIRGAEKLIPEQEALTAKSRHERMTKFLERKEREGLKGEEAYEARKAAQYGAVEKADFSSIRDRVSERSRKTVHELIEDSPLLTDFEKLSAGKAAQNLFSKDAMVVPQEAQLRLLHSAIGPELIRAIAEKAGKRLDHPLIVAGNVLRTAKASADLSMSFRQAVVVAARHPKIFFETSFKDQIKYFLKEENAAKAMADMKNHPKHQLAQKYGLDLMEMDSYLKYREEPMLGAGPLEKIPVYGRLIRASNRAYTVGLSRMRFKIFDKLTDKWEDIGIKIWGRKSDFKGLSREAQVAERARAEKVMSGTARLVNTETGRGSLGRTFNEASAIMNTALFSPRLQKSRLDLMNPLWYKKLPKPVRAEAIKTSLSFVGAGLSVLTLLKVALGDKIDVNLEPTSSDFLKIRVGKTRIDIWGGFQQFAVFLARQILNKTTSTKTGKTTKLGKGYASDTRADVAIRMLRSKAAPLPGLAWDVAEGRKMTGEPVNPIEMLWEPFLPMVAEDLWDILQEDPTLLPVGLAGIFGVGLTTHRDWKKKGKKLSPALRQKILSMGR